MYDYPNYRPFMSYYSLALTLFRRLLHRKCIVELWHCGTSELQNGSLGLFAAIQYGWPNQTENGIDLFSRGIMSLQLTRYTVGDELEPP
jgi:hypothetical protein